MKKNRIKSIKKASMFINQYHSRYGLGITLRVLQHYGYRAIKNYYVNPNETIVKVNGCKMFMVPNDLGISTELSVFKSHEPVTTKIISKTLKKGMTCLDIGSNIGYYVLLERKFVGEEGKIIAVEPSPQNFHYLKKNIELQNVNNITALNFAAGDKEGRVRFFVNKKSNGCKIVPDGEDPPDSSLGSISEVTIKRIDLVVDELGLDRVDFVRMDVEGYELHIFKGMQKTIEKFRPVISIELHKRQLGIEGTREFFKMMKKFGYEVESYIPRDLDIPLIGTMKYVKQTTIDELLNSIEKGEVGSYLMLTLIPQIPKNAQNLKPNIHHESNE